LDYNQKEKLIRRISSGKVFGRIDWTRADDHYVDFCFYDPTPDVIMEADFEYEMSMQLNESELMTQDELLKVLIERGDWSEEKEEEYKKIEEAIKNMQVRLDGLQFKKKELRLTKEAIEKNKNRLKELSDQKNKLFSNSLEYYCEIKKKKFIIQQCLKIKDPSLLQSTLFVNSILVYLNKDSPSEKTIREIARSSPWRIMWATAKDTGTPIFARPASEMTDLQLLLISWTKVYDFAYETMNRPPDDIIEDDIRFDAWYKKEQDRITKEIDKNYVAEKMPDGIKKSGGMEVFIPCDAEGAKEIYQMNNADARMRIKMRENAINQKGEVKEQHLPDLQRDMRMQAVQMINNANK
jgi:hypothetical protein